MQPTLVSVSVASLLASAPSLAAQHPLHTLSGDGANDAFGQSVDIVGDVDGDGWPDLMIGAWRDDNGGKTDSGSVRVVSGRTGATLSTINGDLANDHMGWGSSGAGDADGDGQADILAAADEADVAGKVNAGSAKLVSGATGQTLHFLVGESAGDLYGWSTAAAGDVDGDGHDDVILGALLDDSGTATNCGSARVHSGLTGLQLWAFHGDAASDEAGDSVGGAGDVNVDGYNDLIVGLPGADPLGLSGAGRARVYSGFDGALLWEWTGNSAADSLGDAVAGAGDVDQDGQADLILGSPDEDGSGSSSGRVLIYSGATGLLIRAHDGDAASDLLGGSVCGLGDVDGDGWPDYAAGATGDDDGGFSAGSVRAWSGRTGAVLLTLHGDSPSDALGASVAGGGDVDGDGFLDVIAGAPLDDLVATNAGSARVWNLVPSGIGHYGTGTPGCDGPLLLNASSVPHVGDASFTLQGGHLGALNPGVLALADAADLSGSDPLGLGALLHLALPPTSSYFILLPVFADAWGTAKRVLPIPPDPALAGSVVRAQAASLWLVPCTSLPPSSVATSSGTTIQIAP